MKLKTLMSAVIAACILGSAALGDPPPQPPGTVRIAGTVVGLADSQITLLSGPDTWIIKVNRLLRSPSIAS